MNKKNRLLILIICVGLFLVIAPYLVMYSMGYRINFENWKITATGGIYVRTSPQAEKIIIDSKPEKPGMFSTSVFVQDLIPKEHTVLIKKTGYFDYEKTLQVKEKEVTKIENIILFKNNITFDNLLTSVESFSVSPDKKHILAEINDTKALNFVYFSTSTPTNQKKYSIPIAYTTVLNVEWSNDSSKVLIKTYSTTNGTDYYLFDFSKETQLTTPLSYLDANSEKIHFNPQDSNQTFFIREDSLLSMNSKKLITILKNVNDYKISNGNIIWFSPEGVLSKSDISGNNTEILLEAWPFNKDYLDPINYKIEVISGKIIIFGQNTMFEYDSQEKTLKDLGATTNGFKISASPDNKNIIYYSNSDIYLYAFEKSGYNKTDENNIKLYSANWPEIITNCFWLNNDYIIFESGNKTIISEIDYRGNTNTVELPQNYEPSASSKNPIMFFNSQDNKVYLLNGETLYSSEKLVP